jgi:hypothetical protein
MAITLIEAAKGHRDPMRQGLIESFAAGSDILGVIPFTTIQGNAYQYTQEDALPTVDYRGANESYTANEGILNDVIEPLVTMGGDVEVDTKIVRQQGMETYTRRIAMKVKAASHRFFDTMINGQGPQSSAKDFSGLRNRLQVGSSRVIDNASGNGAALSLNKLDEVIDAVDNPTHLIMSKAMRRLITTASRSSALGGFLTSERDEFGRQIMMYNDLPILIADRNDSAFASISFNEPAPDGDPTTGLTSIYCVSLGDEGIVGIQSADPDGTDFGAVQDKPVYRFRMEWDCGIAIEGKRAAARLRGITTGAVTA